MDIGEAVVASEMVPGAFFVIETEQMKDGGLKIVQVHFPGDGPEAERVGLALHVAAAHAAAGHPGAEALGLVLAALFSMGAVRLRSWLHGVRPNSPLHTTSVCPVLQQPA